MCVCVCECVFLPHYLSHFTQHCRAFHAALAARQNTNVPCVTRMLVLSACSPMESNRRENRAVSARVFLVLEQFPPKLTTIAKRTRSDFTPKAFSVAQQALSIGTGRKS